MKKSVFFRIIALALVFCLAFAFTACGRKDTSSAAGPKDLVKILAESRNAEMNEYYEIISRDDAGYTVTEGYSAEMDDQFKQDQAAMVLEVMGLTPEDMEDFAVSISMMMTKSYGIALIKPAEGRSEAVETALQNFIQSQQMAQEFYLPDQYEIAKNAKLETLADGTVLMVMTADQDTVFEAIKAAIEA